ncbi:MAG: hypothetical protein WC712_07025 [Candidatus Brocadiia bacterium]
MRDDSRKAKWDKYHQDDRRTARRGVLIVAGLALLAVVIVVVSALFTGGPEVAPTPPGSFEPPPDPIAAIEAGTIDGTVLNLMLATIAEVGKSGHLPTLSKAALARVYKYYLSGQSGFAFARDVMRSYKQLPSEATSWKDFLLAAEPSISAKTGSVAWNDPSAWLREFHPKELPPFKGFEELETSFCSLLFKRMDADSQSPAYIGAATDFLRIVSLHKAARGECPKLSAMVERLASTPASPLLVAACSFFGKYLPPDKAEFLMKLLASKDASDDSFLRIASALSVIAPQTLGSRLAVLLTSRPDNVKATALELCGAFDLGRATKDVLSMLRSTDTGVASAAARALTTLPVNCAQLARVLGSLYASLDPEAALVALAGMRNCPAEELPVKFMCDIATKDDRALDAVSQALAGRGIAILRTALGDKITSEPLWFSSTGKPLETLKKLVLAVADADAGREGIDSFARECSDGLNRDKLNFYLELMAASYRASGSQAISDELARISREAPDDATRKKAAAVLKSLRQ